MTPADLKIVENRKEAVAYDPLLTPEQVAKWLNTSIDWVWDHFITKVPVAAGDPLRRGSRALWNSSLPGQQDRGIYCGAGAIFCIPPQELWP
jgi:hypothetical protein